MEPNRCALDVGVVLPFAGSTLQTKLQVRLHGIKNVEIGTPQSFCSRRKKAIIFDTTMAGVDYTMRSIDDKKIGEHKIARLFYTVFSCVEEDLYVLADMSHFKSLYQGRLFTRLLMLLQTEADERVSFTDAAKKFDGLAQNNREDIFSLLRKGQKHEPVSTVAEGPKQEVDYELELKMKMLEKQREMKPAAKPVRDIERDVFTAVQRILGWRTDINLLSQYIGGDIIFHNSCATDEASHGLPKDTCENEKHFRDVMEQWNLLIYEMSGGQKTDQTFFTSKGPESRMRQDIRSLRAFYSSDVEAALEEGKQKLAMEVSRVFQELLGKNQPGNSLEWSTAYLNFLARLEAYLSWISEQVRR